MWNPAVVRTSIFCCDSPYGYANDFFNVAIGCAKILISADAGTLGREMSLSLLALLN